MTEDKSDSIFDSFATSPAPPPKHTLHKGLVSELGSFKVYFG